ncbi:MAG: hypothetical protein JWM33_1605 [Caulobacteraceae bacterium]|nr:hypothetical protein [Caulobacteraceae bacterium]
MVTRDHLVVTAAVLPGVIALGLAFAFTHNLVVAGLGGGGACLAVAAISLTPPVQRARLRLLRSKYPADR